MTAGATVAASRSRGAPSSQHRHNPGVGIGDINGIRSRLAYLKELGIDAIWITPWFPSPQKDHGYDVANYFDIEPDYGTLADAKALIAEARHCS